MKAKLIILGLLAVQTAYGETVTIEATGPWYPDVAHRTFTCARLESHELTRSTKLNGWVSVPKSGRVEGCEAGIWPGRNYHVFITMRSYNANDQLIRTDTLPPYFVWIPPPSRPEPPRGLGVM